MVSFLLFIIITLVIYFCIYIRTTKDFAKRISESVRERRLLLLGESSKTLRRLGLEDLLREVNDLIDAYKSHAEINSGYSNQVESTLNSIQEVVLIFDDAHYIDFANESAKKLFKNGAPIRGAHLESVLRSSTLIEFLEAYGKDPSTGERHVSVERQDETYWFEASCVELMADSKQKSGSHLLVLHDITRLKSLEMVRRDFVANVSHELRTPLTIIKGFAETLVDDNETLPPDVRARFLGKIVNNAERLHVLVEDLLTLSRLESKPDHITPKIQSLKQLFEETLENYRSRLNTPGQELLLKFDDAIQEFAFDRFQINQVIDNLIENAFRYAPDFQQIEVQVHLSEDAAMVNCCVADDGPGILEKDLPHIFERFYRADKGRSRERGGTGLGLSIMKHIVQLHGGFVKAESKIGEGTRIYFSLPYATAVAGERGA